MHGGKPVVCEDCLSAGQGEVASLGGEAGGASCQGLGPSHPPRSPSVSLSTGWESRAARPRRAARVSVSHEASQWCLLGSMFLVGGWLGLCLCCWAPAFRLPLCPLLPASAPALGLPGRALWLLSLPINLT